MKIGILQFELSMPWARSLKDKRRVVKSLKDRLHREHLVSVAEVGAADVWTRAVLGLALVSRDGAYIHGVLDNIERKLRSVPDAELAGLSRELLDPRDSAGPWLDEEGGPLWTADERREARTPEGEASP